MPLLVISTRQSFPVTKHPMMLAHLKSVDAVLHRGEESNVG